MKFAAVAALALAFCTSAHAAQRPEASLNGGFVYRVEPHAATSGQIVQTKLATGTRRVVIDGTMVKVIRTGRYAGYLMVQRHGYRPQGGSFDAIWVVRPDVREVFMVPGTDTDDTNARNTISKAWRRAHAAQFDTDK